MTYLAALSKEYNEKLAEFGVPEKHRTCALELRLATLYVLHGHEEPFAGEHCDYDGLNLYLEDFCERWDDQQREEDKAA